jgi:hypothetical protein
VHARVIGAYRARKQASPPKTAQRVDGHAGRDVFCARFCERESARRTEYKFDAR